MPGSVSAFIRGQASSNGIPLRGSPLRAGSIMSLRSSSLEDSDFGADLVGAGPTHSNPQLINHLPSFPFEVYGKPTNAATGSLAAAFDLTAHKHMGQNPASMLNTAFPLNSVESNEPDTEGGSGAVKSRFAVDSSAENKTNADYYSSPKNHAVPNRQAQAEDAKESAATIGSLLNRLLYLEEDAKQQRRSVLNQLLRASLKSPFSATAPSPSPAGENTKASDGSEVEGSSISAFRSKERNRVRGLTNEQMEALARIPGLLEKLADLEQSQNDEFDRIRAVVSDALPQKLKEQCSSKNASPKRRQEEQGEVETRSFILEGETHSASGGVGENGPFVINPVRAAMNRSRQAIAASRVGGAEFSEGAGGTFLRSKDGATLLSPEGRPVARMSHTKLRELAMKVIDLANGKVNALGGRARENVSLRTLCAAVRDDPNTRLALGLPEHLYGMNTEVCVRKLCIDR